jgi:hypothetical protein
VLRQFHQALLPTSLVWREAGFRRLNRERITPSAQGQNAYKIWPIFTVRCPAKSKKVVAPKPLIKNFSRGVAEDGTFQEI